MPLREEIWSAASLLEMNWAARAAHRDSESFFCFGFGIIVDVDGVIPSSEPISTIVFGEMLIPLSNVNVRIDLKIIHRV